MRFEDYRLRLPVCRKRQSLTLNGSKSDYSVVKVPVWSIRIFQG
jgi:hypothetical protein